MLLAAGAKHAERSEHERKLSPLPLPCSLERAPAIAERFPPLTGGRHRPRTAASVMPNTHPITHQSLIQSLASLCDGCGVAIVLNVAISPSKPLSDGKATPTSECTLAVNNDASSAIPSSKWRPARRACPLSRILTFSNPQSTYSARRRERCRPPIRLASSCLKRLASLKADPEAVLSKTHQILLRAGAASTHRARASNWSSAYGDQ